MRMNAGRSHENRDDVDRNINFILSTRMDRTVFCENVAHARRLLLLSFDSLFLSNRF